MQSTRRRDTDSEVAVRRLLHAKGLRFRIEYPLPGLRRRADVAFPRRHVAVFIDGCFWHGCPDHGTWPKANATWWRDKIEANVARDQDTNRRLDELGWTVIRIWEHEDVKAAADRVESVVKRSAR